MGQHGCTTSNCETVKLALLKMRCYAYERADQPNQETLGDYSSQRASHRSSTKTSVPSARLFWRSGKNTPVSVSSPRFESLLAASSPNRIRRDIFWGSLRCASRDALCDISMRCQHTPSSLGRTHNTGRPAENPVTRVSPCPSVK
jgi:hypothetical protein